MIIAQLSDPHVAVAGTHFHDLYHTIDKLKAAIERVNTLSPRPDFVVMTGDLVNSGSLEEYAVFRDIMDNLDIPVFLGIGNHDNRDNFRQAFADTDYLPADGFIQYVWKKDNLRLLMLDTHVPGHHHGILCEDRLKWLDETLAQDPDIPTVIFMHHPPFITGIKAMDDMGLKDADAFGKIIEKHSQIIHLFCGHLHRSITSEFYGTPAQICPSTSHKVVLHLEKDSYLATVDEPAEILLHIWLNETDLVSHNCFTGKYHQLWKLDVQPAKP